MCLNAAGLAQIREARIVSRLLRAGLDPRSAHPISTRRVLLVLGTQLEELARHHPEIKADIVEDVVAAVKALLALSAASASPNGGASPAAAGVALGEHVNRVASVRRLPACLPACSVQSTPSDVRTARVLPIFFLVCRDSQPTVSLHVCTRHGW